MKVIKFILRIPLKLIMIAVTIAYVLTPIVRLGGVVILIMFLLLGIFTSDIGIEPKIYLGVFVGILLFSQQIMELILHILKLADRALSPYDYSSLDSSVNNEDYQKYMNYLEIKNLIERNNRK